MKKLFILLILLASIVEYLGDSNFKFYARTNNYTNFIYGILSYIILVGLLIYILKYSNVMYMNLSWDALSIIIETLFAYFLLKERLSNRYQLIGLFLIILGIISLSYGKIPI